MLSVDTWINVNCKTLFGLENDFRGNSLEITFVHHISFSFTNRSKITIPCDRPNFSVFRGNLCRFTQLFTENLKINFLFATISLKAKINFPRPDRNSKETKERLKKENLKRWEIPRGSKYKTWWALAQSTHYKVEYEVKTIKENWKT